MKERKQTASNKAKLGGRTIEAISVLSLDLLVLIYVVHAKLVFLLGSSLCLFRRGDSTPFCLSVERPEL
jgi:hypothetical protein